jgi:hypothetical protein
LRAIWSHWHAVAPDPFAKRLFAAATPHVAAKQHAIFHGKYVAGVCKIAVGGARGVFNEAVSDKKREDLGDKLDAWTREGRGVAG